MDMKLKDLLEENKSAILKKWFDAIIETYPTDTSGFLKNQKDRFANPVGHVFTQGIENILAALIEGRDLAKSASFLDDIIKVRAIQDFTPSKAMSFVFLLKNVVRKELEKEIRQSQQLSEALLEFELKIDDLALLSFDKYIKCREQIYKLKTDELKRMSFTLLKKANIMSEIPVEEFEHRD
ncbi:putative component of dissimilatory sulfate reduction system, protein DsrT (second copy apart from operon) [Candidatus Desulfosporosinus infrequens]|uniref:Putative component of dissimilatory sulfate reduction system, protein DsrT (Second copy apart from operon) n=1 Tax=Candidatus Desulfosporosinus infrequens TaxID=2043169 RepID=A0A2U3LPE8_9FIRM|nr:putative component of dissimilatory sulfate reduction system, protein DsrT (second copy apart from operon) [Candidatus Desulfosporosinus infrequens]